MRDPEPSNITGEKVHQHVVEHSVNWSHVLIAVAVIYLSWKFGPALVGSDGEGKDQDPYVSQEV